MLQLPSLLRVATVYPDLPHRSGLARALPGTVTKALDEAAIQQ